jgi:hypothetical protein
LYFGENLLLPAASEVFFKGLRGRSVETRSKVN